MEDFHIISVSLTPETFPVIIVDAIYKKLPLHDFLIFASENSLEWGVDNDLNTFLHHAAYANNSQAIRTLIEAGHPWNALNNLGLTAAEICLEKRDREMYEYLLEAGIKSELVLLSLTGTMNISEGCSSSDYLHSRVELVGDALIDDDMNGVMMEWERPLMERHAEILCSGCDDGLKNVFNVLNVGYGMGIIDGLIHNILKEKSEKNPTMVINHFIVEAHPQVYENLLKNKSLFSCPGLVKTIPLFGKWQDIFFGNEELKGVQFDGIFFDTFGEFYQDLRDWHENVVPVILNRNGGVYSFFNGLGADNHFFNRVYSNIVQIELMDVGLFTQWEEMKVKRDEIDWNGIKRKYFVLENYLLPIVQHNNN